jgi:hypothetical protein
MALRNFIYVSSVKNELRLRGMVMTEKTVECWMVFDKHEGTYKGTWKTKDEAAAPFYRKVKNGVYVPRRVRVTVLPDEGEGEQRGN